jgi:hypothetical protein
MSPLLSLYLGRTATTGTPSITLNSPANTGTVSSTTPTLDFTGVTSTGNQNIAYEIQVDTVNTFNSQAGTITRDSAHEPSTNPFTSTANFTTKQTGGAFTPQAKAAVFVVVGAASNSGTPSATVTDSSGNTYTLLKSNGTAATNLIGVYWFYYASSPGSITVSVQTVNTSVGGFFEVLDYQGVASTQTGNTVAVNRSSAGTLQGSLTVGSSNIAIGGATNFTDATQLAALANSTVAGHYEDSSSLDSYSSFTSTTTGTNTYGYSTSKVGGFVGVEILAGNAPLIDALSSAGTGFADITNGGDSSPYPSGDQIGYTVQAGNALTNSTTYYWRVQQIVPVGNVNYYVGWSSIYSFTVSTGGAAPTNLFFMFFDP